MKKSGSVAGGVAFTKADEYYRGFILLLSVLCFFRSVKLSCFSLASYA